MCAQRKTIDTKAMRLTGSQKCLDCCLRLALEGSSAAPCAASDSDRTDNSLLYPGVICMCSAPLGPGLIYLNGSVANGIGESGTATLVRSLSGNGATLTRTSIPLAGGRQRGVMFWSPQSCFIHEKCRGVWTRSVQAERPQHCAHPHELAGGRLGCRAADDWSCNMRRRLSSFVPKLRRTFLSGGSLLAVQAT